MKLKIIAIYGRDILRRKVCRKMFKPGKII